MGTREIMEKAAENLSVRRAFGTAYERNGLLIVPVAVVAGGGGGGEAATAQSRSHHDPSVETAETTSGDRSGRQPRIGSGGGFGGLVLPLGVYEVKDDQIRWVPAYDATLVILAALGVLPVLIGFLRRSRRGLGIRRGNG